MSFIKDVFHLATFGLFENEGGGYELHPYVKRAMRAEQLRKLKAAILTDLCNEFVTRTTPEVEREVLRKVRSKYGRTFDELFPALAERAERRQPEVTP